ncbi:hypothetical protein PR003_g15433 [Phytophthora rubi]|uniref:Uncharacterized protein n=1 Tax=Phytophthora rubi TaxID=129364 RepID=A0A6A4EZC9_9STRA|nr:hypothetical protein PR003_g15433 [Phytophthora rubi]
MSRRTQRLYEQRRRAVTEARPQEQLDDAIRQRTEVSESITRVVCWWRFEGDDAKTGPDNTYSNTSCVTGPDPAVMLAEIGGVQPVSTGQQLAMAVDQRNGRPLDERGRLVLGVGVQIRATAG